MEAQIDNAELGVKRADSGLEEAAGPVLRVVESVLNKRWNSVMAVRAYAMRVRRVWLSSYGARGARVYCARPADSPAKKNRFHNVRNYNKMNKLLVRYN
eukprot:2832740-Rhodomonas_salina.1